MKPHALGSGATHLGNALADFYFVSFLDQYSVVVGIGAQVSLVVFDDNKLTISDESTAGIDNPSAGGGPHGLARFPGDQKPGAGPLLVVKT